MLIRTLVAVILVFSLIPGSDAFGQSPITQADIARAKAAIEMLKQDIEIKEAELRVMELQLARQSTGSPTSRPAPRPAQASTAKPVASNSPMAPQTSGVEVENVVEKAPKRSNIDPRPYEEAIQGRLNFFRISQGSKWLALDEKRLVYWVLDDEAYLLNLSHTCAGLLDTERLRLQSFSNKVRAGHDGVIFGDQLCLIESISKLGGRSLPKPPRK
jgi:hypothetical protein